MDKKKIITIISIVVTVLVIAIVAVLIIHKNISTTKTTIANKNMGNEEIEEPVEEPTEEIEESPEPTASTKPSAKPKTDYKYYIKVNTQMNTVTIYTKDENGKYTVPVKAMVCSTGNATPKNSKYQTKGKWNWGLMVGGVYTQYETHITGNILFHSVPYLKRYDNGSLEWWAYDKLGTTCSAGCVRLTVADSKWIYDNCAIGTWVEFYSSSDPGPLGKPSAMKISSYEEYRGWDPTDPNSNNPWKNATISTPEPEPTSEPTSEPTPEVTPTTVVPTPTENPTPSAEPTAETTPSQETPEETTTPDTSQSENTETTTTPEITEI